jgi:bifunctional UDP-N-acetylglucosamine pyrophosphorylase/glucosamine-1-phosphate N-acetyltransferase
MEQFDWEESRLRLSKNGVLMMDPKTVYVEPSVSVGAGTMLLPGTILRGTTVIGTNCEIGPNTMIVNCKVGDGTVINSSQCNDSTIGSHTKVGPFAYVRPNCTIGDEVKLGDFVEAKNSVIGDGTKISHLTYVGDTDIGKATNLGCGTVTVNYDGAHKFRTKIGDNVFVGCNTNLVAPVEVGDGAFIAAGSTITDEVPTNALAIARARQVIKHHWSKPKK